MRYEWRETRYGPQLWDLETGSWALWYGSGSIGITDELKAEIQAALNPTWGAADEFMAALQEQAKAYRQIRDELRLPPSTKEDEVVRMVARRYSNPIVAHGDVRAVHALHAGRALCGQQPFPPSSWDEGHVWEYPENLQAAFDRDLPICKQCLVESRAFWSKGNPQC